MLTGLVVQRTEAKGGGFFFALSSMIGHEDRQGESGGRRGGVRGVKWRRWTGGLDRQEYVREKPEKWRTQKHQRKYRCHDIYSRHATVKLFRKKIK